MENHVDAAKRTRDKSETNLQRAPEHTKVRPHGAEETEHTTGRPLGAEETGGADPLSIPKSSACSRYAYRREAEQPPPTANHREQTIIRSTRSRQRNLKLSGWET